MSTDLTPDERDLFNRLIIASGKLATAADNASTILSEQHEEMTRPFIDEVQHILSQCPSGVESEWTGELRDADLEEEIYRTGHEEGREPLGVAIVHLPTGISRQSQSKRTQEENREVAMKSLTKAVAEEYKRRG